MTWRHDLDLPTSAAPAAARSSGTSARNYGGPGWRLVSVRTMSGGWPVCLAHRSVGSSGASRRRCRSSPPRRSWPSWAWNSPFVHIHMVGSCMTPPTSRCWAGCRSAPMAGTGRLRGPSRTSGPPCLGRPHHRARLRHACGDRSRDAALGYPGTPAQDRAQARCLSPPASRPAGRRHASRPRGHQAGLGRALGSIPDLGT